jgi:hypothetical protein
MNCASHIVADREVAGSKSAPDISPTKCLLTASNMFGSVLLISVLASIASPFPQPTLVSPGKTQILKKAGYPFAFASAVAVNLRKIISRRGVAKKRRP